ncbi:uncharacterized protein LOC112523842 [Cynara cardunculus var. scolymus]|uniref:uncharacterized protein LOC112523842 n=1 Tax=Cynara cardunculus var. scolymus TaxID=59895 RepID=UPI000D630A78|nr:uncharacterized protein LOC112523842 [Cynara cardunculus var. scolymus]
MASDASSFSQPNIPKFDGDYEYWSLLMENLLRSKEYWSVVETEVPTNNAELKLKDLKAKNYLFAAIDKNVLKTFTKRETSKQIWDSMKERYLGNEKVKRAQLNRLRRSFEVLTMKNGESVGDYFTRVMIIVNEMRSCGKSLNDIKIVEKILRTLTEKWNYVVCSIEESKNIDELSVDALQSSLLVHE